MKPFINLSMMIGTCCLLIASCNKTPIREDAQENKPVKMNSSTSWTLTQITDNVTEKARLNTSLLHADHFPIGLRKIADSTLRIEVTLVGGNALPKLQIGSDYREKVMSYDLHEGMNTISTSEAGDLYLSFSASNPSTSNQVKVDIISGFTKIPMYVLGKTTNQEWKTMLATTDAPNAILIGEDAYIACSREKAVEFQDKNQDSVLKSIDRIIAVEHKFSGISKNATDPRHRWWDGKLMIAEKASGDREARDRGLVLYPTNFFHEILDPSKHSWGLFHEIGHHHQLKALNFPPVWEVQVNIYSLAAAWDRKPTYKTDQIHWTAVEKYFALPVEERNYIAKSTGGTIRLALYYQLWKYFGDEFYLTLHRLIREEQPKAPASTGDIDGKMQVLMVYASRASGKNLSDFFRKWGFKVPESYYEAVAALNLPAPDKDVTTIRSAE